MKTQRGFTLLELMITLVVIGILTAIALPNYAKYVIRGNIPDATGNLAAKRVQMEQWFQDNRTYAANSAGTNPPACVIPGTNTVGPDTTTSKNFDFSCLTPLNPTTYTLQAVGKGRMAGFTYTVDQNNARTSTFASPAPSTWVPANPNNCWVTKEGGEC